MSRKGKGGGPNRHQITGLQFIRPTPKFLMGMKSEEPTINDKYEKIRPEIDEDEPEREDEAPTVVVLSSGDLSAEQVAAHASGKDINDEQIEDSETDGKRKAADDDDDNEGTADDGTVKFRKPKKGKGSDKANEKQKRVKKSKTIRAEKNIKLLSFGNEEEEE